MAVNPELLDVVHYDSLTRVLSVEDPKFLYYLRNLIWRKFAQKIGYLSTDFAAKYDFALSFAGADREIAEAIANKLGEMEIAVFYDKNEQHRILAHNVEDYLAPIYRSEALLGREYPKRIWTKFESDQFKERFGTGNVIPVWFSDVDRSLFDESGTVGGITFDRGRELDTQIGELVDSLAKKLAEDRINQEARQA
jgi:hypothetical protein